MDGDRTYATNDWQITHEARIAYEQARKTVAQTKREITRLEAQYLYHIAAHYATDTGYCLEIGTATGFSAAVIAQAVAPASLVTLNPKTVEWQRAVQNLRSFNNVQVLAERSWDYHEWASRPRQFDFIFVDGDHGQVIRDLIWFDALTVGGIIVFHDYMATGSARPCQPVVETLDLFANRLGRPFDLRIVDDIQKSLVGFVRRQDEWAPWRLLNQWQQYTWMLNGREWHRG